MQLLLLVCCVNTGTLFTHTPFNWQLASIKQDYITFGNSFNKQSDWHFASHHTGTSQKIFYTLHIFLVLSVYLMGCPCLMWNRQKPMSSRRSTQGWSCRLGPLPLGPIPPYPVAARGPCPSCTAPSPTVITWNNTAKICCVGRWLALGPYLHLFHHCC